MLIVATREGHAQTVRLLLENGVYIDGHVTIAALYGHTPIVKLLLEEGADVNLKHCFCGTPLRAAAGEGHREIMQLLLEAGADINHDDPVYYAVSGGRKEVVELLLEKGAIINAWGGTTASGKSTIAIATSKGHKEIEELLIGRGAHAYTYGYCTQGCLLGLVRGNDLDENCPNVSLHRQGGDGVGHAIDVGTFARLIQTQLKEALHLDQDCEPLGIQGARGALFKVTLAAYGYTVVGKGTVKAFMPDLLHEGKIYQRLTRLQGTAVPVYLENINLIEWYYPDVRVRILHMLLMSWGSNLAEEDESIKDSSEVQKEIKRTMTEVRRAGVDQMDVRSSNLLWNREAQRVMLIDFERAAMAKCGLQDNGMHEERVMQEMSPNKKRKRAGSLERKR
jgi:hypothetical protein